MGRANCMAVGNVNGNATGIFAGTAGGDLWRRLSGTWAPLTDDQPFLGISDLLVDEGSSTSSYVMIATGDADGQHNPSLGIYLSDDYGNTWSETGLTFNDNELVYIYDLEKYGAIDGGYLFAATTDGLYISDDTGDSWDLILDNRKYDLPVSL